MKKSSITPRKKGSWIKDRLRTNEPETTKTENVITLEYLKQYFDAFHPKDGTALNIIASLDDPNLNKITLINKLISDGANKYKALEFAFKNNNAQAEYLLNHITFEPNPSLIQAIQNQSLTLVKYFVEEKEANVNLSNFGFNPLSFAVDLVEPYKTDITYYLLAKGAILSNTTVEETEQDSQNVTNLYKQIFFKAVTEKNFEVIKNIVENTKVNVNATNLENTALSIAINFEDKEIANYLISKKADTTAAISAAATKGNLDGIKLLLEAGANIDGNKDESPLMLAAEYGYTSVVKYLLEHGADYNVKGWKRDNLNSDVSFQLTKITEISTLCKKANNTNTQKMLDKISLTSISSNYDEYRNLSPVQIEQQFSKFKKQLKQDLQNFVEINALLEDYSSGRKAPINTYIVVDDEGYVSDFKIETKKTKTGSKLGDIPSPSGIFRTFSLEGLNALDEEQTSLGGDIDIFDSELNG